MSKYVLNENTAMVLNGELYLLAREKEVTKNSVCDKCSLNDICIDAEDNHRFADLCIPEEEDQRWFFVRNIFCTKEDRQHLMRIINKCFPIK